MRHWHVDPDWQGLDVFLVCGGTSVVPAEVEKLRGRPNSKVVVINSSYTVAPWADMLFFADERWWLRELAEGRREALEAFEGAIVTNSWKVQHPRFHHLKRALPPGLSRDRGTCSLQFTSVTAVLNICLHKKAARVVLIGVDGRDGENGRAHHHAEYPWPRNPETYDVKEREFESIKADLERGGVVVLNASPITTSKVWPRVNLADFLEL